MRFISIPPKHTQSDELVTTNLQNDQNPSCDSGLSVTSANTPPAVCRALNFDSVMEKATSEPDTEPKVSNL